jgi:AcrR family transcriptional regulator
MIHEYPDKCNYFRVKERDMTTTTAEQGASGRLARRPGGRSARVRRAVFEATLALVAERGYGALAVEAVAVAAGVNKTTVYRNWPTKAALVLAALSDRSESMIRTETTGDPERDLVSFLASVAASISSPLGQALVIATLNEAHDPELRRTRDEFWRHRFDAARELVGAAIAAGLLPEGTDADAVIERLIGPVFLRVFITGAAVDEAFIHATVGAAIRREGRGSRVEGRDPTPPASGPSTSPSRSSGLRSGQA